MSANLTTVNEVIAYILSTEAILEEVVSIDVSKSVDDEILIVDILQKKKNTVLVSSAYLYVLRSEGWAEFYMSIAAHALPYNAYRHRIEIHPGRKHAVIYLFNIMDDPINSGPLLAMKKTGTEWVTG